MGADGERFHMREKLLAIGNDFWIENDRGERVYKVNAKAFRVRETFVLADMRPKAGEDAALILAVTVAIDSLTTR